MKHPHIPLYTGDWMKDTELSLCTPATRGVWIDLLCAMHERNRSGELRGTSEQLARLARCSTVELDQAFTDLQTTGAAIVDNRNGIWTIANRRMRREAITRERRQQAGSIGGSKTQAGREQTPYDNDIDNDSSALERVREFARGKGIGMKDADWFFWKGKGSGWTNRGEPIRDWKATLLCWFRAGYLPSQKRNSQFSQEYKKPAPTGEAYQRIPPAREPTEEELAKQRKIVREASEKLKAKFRGAA
jgi:hypothetical protein